MTAVARTVVSACVEPQTVTKSPTLRSARLFGSPAPPNIVVLEVVTVLPPTVACANGGLIEVIAPPAGDGIGLAVGGVWSSLKLVLRTDDSALPAGSWLAA